ADLRTEYQANPVGIDARAPRLSWKIESPRRGTVQTACQIRVALEASALERRPLWDSGKVASDASIHRVYGGPALESGQRYYWQVRVWDDAGRSSPWSAPAYWEMGLLRPSDWSADWITPDVKEDTAASNPSPMLRAEFRVEGKVASARAYVTSLGLYEMELNGRRVGDQLFRPGWTAYDARLEKDGWSRPGYHDTDWAAVRVLDHSKQILVAPAGPPVRRIQELKPVKVLVTPSGDTVFDMGQNMVGWVRLKVRGPRGTTVRLRHAEVLDRKGDFYTDNLRSARQTVEYTLKGGNEEVYDPHF